MLVVAVHLTAVIIFCFEWAVPETGEEKKSGSLPGQEDFYFILICTAFFQQIFLDDTPSKTFDLC